MDRTATSSLEVEAVLAVAPIEHGDLILDLGCGAGDHSLELARRGFRHVTGVDRSGDLMRAAREAGRNQFPPVVFMEGDPCNLRLGRRFDHVVILGNSICDCTGDTDRRAIFASCRRVLFPGGRLVVDITCMKPLRQRFDRASEAWMESNYGTIRRAVVIDRFYADNVYATSNIINLLEDLAFDKIQVHVVRPIGRDLSPGSQTSAYRILITALRGSLF